MGKLKLAETPEALRFVDKISEVFEELLEEVSLYRNKTASELKDVFVAVYTDKVIKVLLKETARQHEQAKG